MKVKPLAAGGIAAAFVGSVTLAQYDHTDGHFHFPPGNAPIALALSAAISTTTVVGGFLTPFNAIHDADYLPPPDTTSLKSDGQTEKA